MESKQYPTSLRLSETEKEYLTKIAYDNALLKSNNEPSLGLAIKHLIREKILENKEEKQGENVVISDDINHLVKLTEQINIMIPHLVHAAQISTKCLLGKINDTEIAKKIFWGGSRGARKGLEKDGFGTLVLGRFQQDF